MSAPTRKRVIDDGDFEALYLQYFDMLVGIAVRKFHVPASEAEALANEVFFSYLRRSDEIENLPKWLVGAICYASRYYWRQNGRIIDEVESGLSFDRMDDPASARILDSLPEQLAVREALERLKPRYREILYMRFFEGCSINEIAGRLGVTPKYAQKLVIKCLRSAERMVGAKGTSR